MSEIKNILITGSSSGIGLVAANYFKELGHKVFQTGRKDLALNNYFRGDLTNFKDVESLFSHAFNYLGKIDVLINNAGEYAYCPIEKAQYEHVLTMAQVNLIAPFMLTSLVVEGMKKNRWGRIINIGSISGSVGEGNAAFYSSTKAGLIGMAKALGLELAEFGITVNTINPGWVKGEMANEACLNGDFSVEDNLDVIPQKRFIEPIEIAQMAAFLISDGAKGVTGQSINLCAGLSVG